ncbi:S1 family peptidase [Planosporangium sp. 12N6]|uniref:S1 family peptidase n=1 Tax=Planosporangium spinosum TaxID=3402278 RepID=UPI003CEAFC42
MARKIRLRFDSDRVVVRLGVLARPAVLRVPEAQAQINLTQPGSEGGVTAQDSLGSCPTNVYCTPTRGGVLLQQASGGYVWSCTSTVLGVDRAGRNATLTAGHCFDDPNAPVYAGRTSPEISGYRLGYRGDRNFAGTADVEEVEWFGNNGGFDKLNNCLIDYSQDCRRVTRSGSGDDFAVGRSVQKSGITTHLTSGSVTRSSVNVNIDDNGFIVSLADQLETSACVRPGDSGGPLFSGSTLLGITSAVGGLDDSGNCTVNTRSYFSKIGNATAAIGFSPRYS